jgi:hypothetical protein
LSLSTTASTVAACSPPITLILQRIDGGRAGRWAGERGQARGGR